MVLINHEKNTRLGELKKTNQNYDQRWISISIILIKKEDYRNYI